MGRRRQACIVALIAVLAACAEPGALPTDPEEVVTSIDAVVAAVETSPTVDAEPPPTPLTLPDITARPLTVDDLAAMLPAGFPAKERTNGDLVTLSGFDADDAASDVVVFGRETGVAATAPSEAGPVHIWIDVLADADAARRYLLDTAGDMAKGVGGTHAPDIGATMVTDFPITVGEQAMGLTMGLDQGGPEATGVLFRLGRIVVFTAIEHAEGADLRVPIQYLADDLAARILATVLGRPVKPVEPTAPPYRFQTTLTVASAAGDPTVVESTGAVSGDDVSCSIVTSTDTGQVRWSVALVSGTLWTVATDGRPRQVGGGNLTIRSLLALCPSWPLRVDAAGLVVSDQAIRRRINGVNALGHTPDPASLVALVGLPGGGVTVESFSFWTAEGTPWVVEIGYLVAGPAAVLAPLLPPGMDTDGEIRVTLRHRIVDLGVPVSIDPAVLGAGQGP